MDHLFDMRPERPGYRLQRLEILNWGTFDSAGGEVYRFEPEGRTSLLVGHNGSGKSTLVDAILTLLVDARTRNYNVAAGAKKTERSEKSYIRGAYNRTSSEEPTSSSASVIKYLRPKGNNLTAIAAVFADEQLRRTFTLCQVLYLTSDGSPEKIFSIVDEPRELKCDLAGLRASDEVRAHLKQLGYQTTKTFVEYHGWLAKRTRMRSKAMGMFNQTVAVKDIQSLNDFIRRHMLEANDWRDKVQRLLKHFNDLSEAHQELVRARKAEELLQPVEKHGGKYRRQLDMLQQAEDQLAAAETFFQSEIIRLFEPEIGDQEGQLAATADTINRLGEELKVVSKKIRQLENEIDQAGGDRLRQIPDLIEIQQAKLELKQTAFTRYHEQLKLCGIRDVVGRVETFAKTRQQLQSIAASSRSELDQATHAYEELIGRRGELRHQLREEQSELEVLEQRRTNLPPRCSALRSRICEDLNLEESALPFAAELISVLPQERRWEASAEMVLRSFALSLLVPERYYPRVRTYVEQTRIADHRGEGQRLDYLRVGKCADVSGDRLHPQSLVRKLQFKPRHDLTPWVRGEIQRKFDFCCCESVEEFNETKRLAMTANRHVKIGVDRHKKDDRPHTVDPRHFILGWDNREKKRRIAEIIRALQDDLIKVEESVGARTGQLDKLRTIQQAARAALEMADFDAIDVNRHQNEIAALREEQKQLLESNDVVQALRMRLDIAEAEQEGFQRQLGEEHERKALLTKQIADGRQLLSRARKSIETAKSADTYEPHARMFTAISQSLGAPPLSTVDLFERKATWEAATNKRIQRLRQPLQELADRLVSAMSRFLREFKEEQDDLDASVHSLDSFLALLNQVRHEDLPRYEKRFKDRLNDKVSQEVAIFNTELRQEQKQIENKIDQLNVALAELEYHPGTFMRLEPRAVHDREIDDFRRSLRECLDESLEPTDEANEARFLRIQALVQRLADPDKTRWRDKVIDVRNWYDFAARELLRETGETRSFYDGSSGQSGGEKAKLAFTILVAAIAYQFDIDPSGHTSGRFQFAIVDEMFSKVDDQNAEYALKLFEQFGLQLLIVAPLDAKARITEPFVDSYLHVVKDETTHRSQLYSMTAREYEEVVSSFASNGMPATRRRTPAK